MRARARAAARRPPPGFTRKCLTYDPLARRAGERERDCMNRNVSPDPAYTQIHGDWILGVSWIIAKVKSSVRHVAAAQRRPMINDRSTASGSALRDATSSRDRTQDPPRVVGWLPDCYDTMNFVPLAFVRVCPFRRALR